MEESQAAMEGNTDGVEPSPQPLSLSTQKYQLKEELSTPADYFEAKKDEYITCCKVIERDCTLIDLQLSVTTEAEAEAICNNWHDHSAEIYANIIAKLLAVPSK